MLHLTTTQYSTTTTLWHNKSYVFLVLLDIILLLIIIQFAYIKIAFEMYGQYHLPRGKNPALSCLIGFVSMDRAKQQNYSTIQYYKW